MKTRDQRIWKFFDNIEEEGIAVCITCHRKLQNNRVSNLKSHLLKLHNMVIDTVREDTPEIPTVSSSKVVKKSKTKIENNKKQLLRSYIGLITDDSIPFKILNSPNMKNILNPICESLRATDGRKIYLNASNCKKSLQLVANNIRSDIATELKNCLLSIKIDSVTQLYRNILCISAQFICNSQIESRILGLVETKDIGPSASKTLKAEITKKLLEKYHITVNQIVSVTSDDGANMFRATKMPSLLSEEEIEENEADCTNDEYLKKIELVEEMPHMLLGNIQVCRTSAHIAQLCALDATKSTCITKYILTCRNLTKYVRNMSNGYRDIFESKQWTMPQLDCPTRWGSTYKMIENLKAAKDALSKIVSIKKETQDENFVINESFWEFVDIYCFVFNPLQKTINIFQKEQLHYGNFYAQWLKCKICTETIIKASNQPLVQTLGDRILQSLEKRTATLMRNNSLIACLYLDPRFHHTLTVKQKTEATKYLKTIWDRISYFNPEDTLNSTPSTSTQQSINQFADVEDALLNEYLSRGIQEKVTTGVDVHTKIKNLHLPFLRSDKNVLTFWKEKEPTDLELYKLSNVCFAIPATQVVDEEAFSALTAYQDLSEEELENILLVKLNPSSLDTAIENFLIFEDQDDDKREMLSPNLKQEDSD